MAPRHVIDYVVVHELVHLKIKNHSKVYWNEVGKVMPDYNQYRNWLKENGHRLTLD
jgi:predicted metal-dependent hydrolase